MNQYPYVFIKNTTYYFKYTNSNFLIFHRLVIPMPTFLFITLLCFIGWIYRLDALETRRVGISTHDGCNGCGGIAYEIRQSIFDEWVSIKGSDVIHGCTELFCITADEIRKDPSPWRHWNLEWMGIPFQPDYIIKI